jgi:hypothetical protein
LTFLKICQIFTISVIFSFLLTNCSATKVLPEATKVRISKKEPKGCEYLGEATGDQGNFFTGKWTSNANLEEGARNSLKNKAAKMGGNVVVILTDRAGQTGSAGPYGGSSSQTNVVYSGTVYKCPPSTL